MSTTPAWVPLAVAAIGLVGAVGGTLGGVVLTQRRADAREVENRAAEARRERARWAREDELRTFEQRRDAYIAFFEADRDAVRLFNQCQYHRPSRPLPAGWTGAMWVSLQRVEIYGSAATVAIAQRAFEIVTVWESFPQDEGIVIEADNAPWKFIEAVRAELGIPGADAQKPDQPPAAPTF
jgi:hypothetical protein